MPRVRSNKLGASLIEVIVAVFMLSVFIGGAVFLSVENIETIQTNSDHTEALALAQEGIEATYSMHQKDWCNLTNGSYGLSSNTEGWEFMPPPEIIEKYARTVIIEAAYRNASGTFVTQDTAGAVLDDDAKKITSRVTWTNSAASQQKTELVSYAVRWEKLTGSKNGLLVYTSAGAYSGTVTYKVFNGVTNTWGAPQTFSGGTVNMRTARLYSSPTRDEIVLVSKTFNNSGSVLRVEARIFSNCTGFGSSFVLASNVGAEYQLNYDATYLANGDLMVVYVDMTNSTPKYRIWNGITWSSQYTMNNLTQAPFEVVVRARPGTNEVMAVFHDNQRDTKTMYFNGGSYIDSNWTTPTVHATDSTIAQLGKIGFEWFKTDPLKGSLIYLDSINDKNINYRLATANGSGGVSWSTPVNTSDQSVTLLWLELSMHQSSPEFISCAGRNNFLSCFTGTITPSWTNPTNQSISNKTYAWKSFDVEYESLNGNQGLIVYNDNTTIPKAKKFDKASQTWDAAPMSVATLISKPGLIDLQARPSTDDILVSFSDLGERLYTVFWNGTSNAFYTSPDLGFRQHSAIGVTEFYKWWAFAWDI